MNHRHTHYVAFAGSQPLARSKKAALRGLFVPAEKAERFKSRGVAMRVLEKTNAARAHLSDANVLPRDWPAVDQLLAINAPGVVFTVPGTAVGRKIAATRGVPVLRPPTEFSAHK